MKQTKNCKKHKHFITNKTDFKMKIRVNFSGKVKTSMI